MDADRDAQDARRAQAGDRDAFAALVQRYVKRVHDLARRMLRDEQEAEDVTQQAFWNAWRALDRFDASRPFRHWLLRIASNLCRNRFASRRRRPADRARGGDDPAPDPAAPPAGAGDPDPAGPLVRAAIEALPERYRLPVVLHYLQGCSLEEISEITQVPVATVKTHLHRGRAALRDLLAPGETPGPAGGTEE
jgi:RNA polymerase sigma-70 factor, ECF subfamily